MHNTYMHTYMPKEIITLRLDPIVKDNSAPAFSIKGVFSSKWGVSAIEAWSDHVVFPVFMFLNCQGKMLAIKIKSVPVYTVGGWE